MNPRSSSFRAGRSARRVCPDRSFRNAARPLVGLFGAMLVSVAASAAHLYVETIPPGWTNMTQTPWVTSWGDYDGDGYLDAFVARSTGNTSAATNLLYHNNQDGSFTLQTAEQAGPIATDQDISLGGYWADVNHDGALDLLVINNVPDATAQPILQRLYINQGNGRFSAAQAGDLSRPNYAFGWGNWCDYNRDGWLDVFVCGAWADSAHRTNLLYRGRPDATFEQITTGAVATNRLTTGFANDSLWIDLDNDGDQDLLVSNWPNPTRNFVYRNDGAAGFTRMTNSLLEQPGYATVRYSPGDFDNDGDIDLIASGTSTWLLLNKGAGEFVLSQTLVSVVMSAQVGDDDNDGDLDVLLSPGYDDNLRPRLFRNDGTGHLEPTEEAFTDRNFGGSWWVDFDNDGDLDISAGRRQMGGVRHVIFRHQGTPNHWLKLRLVGTASNRSAIGAKVRVKATLRGKPVVQLREVFSSNMAIDGLRPHFGLGDATQAEEVVIEWPSGNIQTLTNIPADQILTVTEQNSIRPQRPVVTLAGSLSLTSGTLGSAYQWYHEGTPLDGQTRRILTLTNAQTADSGRYAVVVQTDAGHQTNQVYVTVDDRFTKIHEGDLVSEKFGTISTAWFDYDGDGWLDVYVPLNWDVRGLSDSLFHNQREGSFIKIPGNPLTHRTRGTFAGAIADFDNDGDPDVFASRSDAPGELLRNDGGGVFTSVSASTFQGSRGQGFMGAWVDYDRDGDVDLLVAYGYIDAPAVEALFRNEGNGTFSERTAAEVGTLLSDRLETFNVSWSDVDGDGWPDALVQHSTSLRLHRNRGDGTFTRIRGGSLDTHAGDASHAWGDFDNDGDLDLIVSRWRNGVAGIHRNLGDLTFAYVPQAGDFQSSRHTDDGYATWGDYDNDGHLDLFYAHYTDRSWLYRNRGDGTFQAVEAGNLLTDGIRRGQPTWVDYDNDGFLDLMLACGDAIVTLESAVSNHLFRNRSNGNHWLKVKLVGTTSNRDGTGARVRVRANIGGQAVTQTREIGGDSGPHGVPLLAHFGLSYATRALWVRIEWPSGIVQQLNQVPADQWLTVTEPKAIRVSASIQAEDVRLECRGAAGLTYQFQASEDLRTWANLAVVVSDGDGVASHTVPRGAGWRFFRVQQP